MYEQNNTTLSTSGLTHFTREHEKLNATHFTGLDGTTIHIIIFVINKMSRPPVSVIFFLSFFFFLRLNFGNRLKCIFIRMTKCAMTNVFRVSVSVEIPLRLCFFLSFSFLLI